MQTFKMVLLSAATLWGCGPSGPSNDIVIGAVMSKTGSQAYSGLEGLQAINLALSEINAAGGVLGRPLKLVDRDDGSDAMLAKGAADGVLASNVPVIIGAVSSSLTLQVLEQAAAKQTVLISPSATSVTLSVKDDFFFRTCTSDAVQSKILAKRARSRSPALSKMAIMYVDDGAYGPGLANDFETEFVRLGGTVTSKVAFSEGASTYASSLTQALTGDPEGIMLIAYPTEGAQLIKDYLQAYPGRPTVWLFSDGVVDPSFVAGVGATRFTFPHEGTAGSNAVGPRYDTYKASFNAKYGSEPSPGAFSANAYDAVYLAALAMAAGNAATGEVIKANLTAVSSGGTAFSPSQYAEAVAALKAGTDINFEGASGPVDFDEYGTVAANFDIWRVTNGVITITDMNISL